MKSYKGLQEDNGTYKSDLDGSWWQEVCDIFSIDLCLRLLKKGCRSKLVYLIATMVLMCTIGSFLNIDKYFYQQQGWYKYWWDKNVTRMDALPDEPFLESDEQSIVNITQAYENEWVGFPGFSHADCKGAFNGTAKNAMFPKTVARIFPQQLKLESEDCVKFRKHYGFLRHPKVSDDERDFPLAYTVLFYKDIDQILFLLRAIYRPHNVYCLTVDIKSTAEFLDAVHSVVRCLPNVFVATKLEHVVYAGFTRLKADINCMEDLLQHPVQWKYVMNLPGQQFPLRTNLELVRILQLFNGSNDIEGLTGNRMLSNRFIWNHTYVTDNNTGDVYMVKNNVKNSPPPHGIEVVKGSAYGTFSRAFVHFVVNHQVAKDFLAWCKFVSSPDEYYWATLHHSKTIPVPGGYLGEPDKKPWLSTYASWGGPCATIYTRGVCIFSTEDLPHLLTRKEIFANKFYITHHPAALHCLDQFIYNLTFAGTVRDLEYYQGLLFAIKTINGLSTPNPVNRTI